MRVILAVLPGLLCVISYQGNNTGLALFRPFCWMDRSKCVDRAFVNLRNAASFTFPFPIDELWPSIRAAILSGIPLAIPGPFGALAAIAYPDRQLRPRNCAIS